MESIPIVVEQVYPATSAEVWAAITQPDQMRKWFFSDIADFRADPGFTTEFNVHHEGVDYLHQWKVTEVVPGSRISYDWHYAGIEGESSVSWEISETTEGAKLVLSHYGQETFPQDNPAFTRESGQDGWEYLLNQALKAYLELDKPE